MRRLDLFLTAFARSIGRWCGFLAPALLAWWLLGSPSLIDVAVAFRGALAALAGEGET